MTDTAGEPAQDMRDIGVVLHSPHYLGVLSLAALIGAPISLVAFGFLAAVHRLEHAVWHDLPEYLGYDHVPAWWAVPLLGLAAVLVGLVVTRLPGGGGHVPADGLSAGSTPPADVPGVILAAGAGLALGAVLGPEAPLMAVGGGLALLAVKRTRDAESPDAGAVLAAAGAAAAISAIFGNPLVAAVMFLEVGGLARRKAMLLVLPCLLSSGVGALVFTGLGDWTGLGIGALAIPSLPKTHLVLADVLWTLPLAAVVAVATWAVFLGGRRTAAVVRSRTLLATVCVGLLAGAAAALYAVVTGHSPVEVALSGQATLPTLATAPGRWSTGALLLLLACKGVAYALCLGAFRGGPVFPALFLGAAWGALASSVLPGLGAVPGLAVGMAAGAAAATRLPVTSIVLVVLLLGEGAAPLMPVVILAAVVALVIDEMSPATTQSAHSTG